MSRFIPMVIVWAAAAATAMGEQMKAPAVVPLPAVMTAQPGTFSVTPQTRILTTAENAELRAIGQYLADWFRNGTGYELAIDRVEGPAQAPDGAIVLTTQDAKPDLGYEGYELTITPRLVTLRAPQPRGVFRGLQTIRQLLPPELERPGGVTGRASFEVPCVAISDQPRYQWRGMLLDCCRHFMTKEFVKRYIDLLAYHKMNVLHWHLTEDQGWRIEIKGRPLLTEISAWRGEDRYGGFYSQDDIREVVAYAASRYITVVPEIEMPGHSQAALSAYPELSCTGGPFEVGTRWGIYEEVYCAGNEATFKFLEEVLAEVMELFPSEFIHIGGDECPKTRWKACSKCQARIKSEGLANEHELQSYFIRRMEKYLNDHGRRIIGWDEILEGGLAPNATVQSWRGMRGAVAAAKAGHDVISSPTSHCYLDYPQNEDRSSSGWRSVITLERSYSFEPTPPELTAEEAKHVLGAEGNIWTERAPQDRVDHQVFPRLSALAEVTWSPARLRNWDGFAERMATHYRRLDALGVRYYVQPPRCTTPLRVFGDVTEVAFDAPVGGGVIRITQDGSDPTPQSPKYAGPLRLTGTTMVKARTFLPNGNTSDATEMHFVKQQPREAENVPASTPGLRYSYYEGNWRRLPKFSALTAAATGTVASFDLGVRKRPAHFAVLFEGYVEVPAAGVYTFYLSSDDGSRLLIGSDVVVDYDGLHGAGEKSGQIMLKAGQHPITVAYFQASGARKLTVSYEGPGTPRQEIPPQVLIHDAR